MAESNGVTINNRTIERGNNDFVIPWTLEIMVTAGMTVERKNGLINS